MIPKGKRRARLAQRIRNARAAAEASNKQTKIEQIKTKAQHPETKQGRRAWQSRRQQESEGSQE